MELGFLASPSIHSLFLDELKTKVVASNLGQLGLYN